MSRKYIYSVGSLLRSRALSCHSRAWLPRGIPDSFKAVFTNSSRPKRSTLSVWLLTGEERALITYTSRPHGGLERLSSKDQDSSRGSHARE